MDKIWKDAILEKVPHGEEGHLQLDFEEVVTLQKILLDKGYAVCVTGGDCKDEYKISWIYAGTSADLDWADDSQICFTSVDYIEDYPEAYYREYGLPEECFKECYEEYEDNCIKEVEE